MPYDLFISYSRRDNVNNRVTELKNQIENDYLEFAKEPLNCFFDQEEIKGMDNWPDRLQIGLKDSYLMLVILSPNYLASSYCECEIIEYLKYEYSRGVAGDGVAQVYFMEIPGIDDEDFRAKAAAWLEKVSRRQRIDLRPWRDEGADSLKRIDVKKRLEELKEALRKRITRMRVISEVPGNLPAPNPRFVGREREMEMLHKATALGQLGVITAVHGIGGLGKTAIAFQYAYAYANFYPGGRWYLGCANETSLASVIKRLDSDLNITLTEDEKKDDIRGAKRILNELYTKAVENAEKANLKTNVGDSVKDYIKPAVLLILDNVDHPELIQAPCTDLLSGKEWLKILVTTRLGPEELGEDETTQKLLTIDELPFEDGVSLIESYQPGGRFINSEEKEKAGEIVKRVGGFTLAVEVAALYLYEKKGRVSCAEFLEILKAKGGDWVGENTKKQLSHTKLISVTLAPTLDSLSPQETLILSYASLLPPDSIPLPWLKALVVKEYPYFDEEEMAGIDNPWISTINHLLSLRLLQVVELDTESSYPRIVRMHRLIQDQIKGRFSDNYDQKLMDELIELAGKRSDYLEKRWHETVYQWEIGFLVSFVIQLLDCKNKEAPRLVKWLSQWLVFFDTSTTPELILRRAIAQLEADKKTVPTEVAILQSNLGLIVSWQARFSEAENLMRKALAIDEKHREPTHNFIAIRLINLANILKDLNRTDEAETLIRRALTIEEHNFGPDDPELAPSLHILSSLLEDKGRSDEAEILQRRAISLFEKSLGPNHPHLASALGNLAIMLYKTNRFGEAEELMRRSLAINEHSLGAEHPHVANGLNNLAQLLKATNRLVEAEPLMRRALAIWEKKLVPDHPQILEGMVTLATLLDARGFFKEAATYRNRVLEAQEGTLGPEHPDFIRSLNHHAYGLRKAGFVAEAEFFDRRAAETSSKLLGNIHPLTIHRYNNLVLTLIMLGKLEEARQILAANWRLNAPSHANTTPRIAFLRHLIALLESQPDTSFLGQLKTLLTGSELPVASAVAVPWDIAYFIEFLKPKLGERNATFLIGLVAALNDCAKMPDLDEFPEWCNTTSQPLD